MNDFLHRTDTLNSRKSGPLGATLGTIWSVGQLMANPVFKGSDPFCHHGEIAMFYRAEQYMQTRASQKAFYKSRDDLDAPYYSTITCRLPIKAKLFLVPSLSEANNQQARDAQHNFKKSLWAVPVSSRQIAPFEGKQAQIHE